MGKWPLLLRVIDTFGHVLTLFPAHPTVHPGCLLPRLVPILLGPCSGPDRPERVHPIQLLPSTRAVRPKTARKTSPHGPSRDGPRRRSYTRAIHPGPRQTALNAVFVSLLGPGSKWPTNYQQEKYLIDDVMTHNSICFTTRQSIFDHTPLSYYFLLLPMGGGEGLRTDTTTYVFRNYEEESTRRGAREILIP